MFAIGAFPAIVASRFAKACTNHHFPGSEVRTGSPLGVLIADRAPFESALPWHAGWLWRAHVRILSHGGTGGGAGCIVQRRRAIGSFGSLVIRAIAAKHGFETAIALLSNLYLCDVAVGPRAQWHGVGVTARRHTEPSCLTKGLEVELFHVDP